MQRKPKKLGILALVDSVKKFDIIPLLSVFYILSLEGEK